MCIVETFSYGCCCCVDILFGAFCSVVKGVRRRVEGEAGREKGRGGGKGEDRRMAGGELAASC
jgi:hypothetical protein